MKSVINLFFFFYIAFFHHAQFTTVIQLWATSDGENTSIGEVLVKEGLAAVDNSCDENSYPSISETLTTSSEITKKDLEAILNNTSQEDAQKSHVISSSKHLYKADADTALSAVFRDNSVTSIEEETSPVFQDALLLLDRQQKSVMPSQQAFEVISNSTSNMNSQTSSLTQTQVQSFENPSRESHTVSKSSKATFTQTQFSESKTLTTREAETSTDDLNKVLCRDSQGSSVEAVFGHSSRRTLPTNRETEEILIDMHPTGMRVT